MNKQYVLSEQDYNDIMFLLNRVRKDLVSENILNYKVLGCRQRIEEALYILDSEE